MADNFEVGIGGNIDGLKKALNEGVAASNKFEKSVVSSGVRVESAVAAMGKGGVTLNKFTAQTNSAGFALTNLGRVAQDAPFGFIGIQNNLNPLLESFGRLKQETGSVGGAFKALGQSLIGPAGLGIALSVVSAAVLFYQQYQQKANKTVNEAKKGSEDYIKTLDQVTQAQLKGAQNAVSELTTLKLLYAQTQNLALSQKQRIEASDELQSKYPAYFKNLSDETILAGGASVKYKELAQAILATARARAAEDLISANTKRQLENEQKLIDLTKERNKLTNKKRSISNAAPKAEDILSEGGVNTFKIAEIESKRLELLRSINNLKTDSTILDGRNLELIKSINSEIAKGAKLSGGVGDLGNGGKDPKNKRFSAVDYADGIGLGALEKRVAKGMKDSLLKSSKDTQIIPVEFGVPSLPESAKITGAEIFKEYFDYDLLPQLGSSFENFFNDILEKGEFSFKSLGQSIKKTFASVLASEATQGLLNALGQKGKAAEGKGGLFPALAGLLGKGKGAAGAATTGTGAAGAGGILAGFSPAALAIGGAVIAGSLINSIVKGVNKNKQLPNLYGADGSSFIGESRSRGNDLLQTWYRTEKRKGR